MSTKERSALFRDLTTQMDSIEKAVGKDRTQHKVCQKHLDVYSILMHLQKESTRLKDADLSEVGP